MLTHQTQKTKAMTDFEIVDMLYKYFDNECDIELDYEFMDEESPYIYFKAFLKKGQKIKETLFHDDYIKVDTIHWNKRMFFASLPRSKVEKLSEEIFFTRQFRLSRNKNPKDVN